MYAIIQVGSTQYKVSPGDCINTTMINQKEERLEIKDVLLFANGPDIRVGNPFVSGVQVTAQVLKQTLGKKVLAFKFKKRKDFSWRKGHRQKLAVLKITDIQAV